MAKRKRNQDRTAERLGAQAVRCHCGARIGERCRTTMKARFPNQPTTTHQSRITGLEETRNLGRGRAMIGYVVVGVLGGGLGLMLGALANAARHRPVFAPAAVEWVCRECGKTSPPERGERRQLNLEVWDTYGHMLAQWPVGEGEQLGSRPVGPWVQTEVGTVVAQHNALTARALKVVK